MDLPEFIEWAANASVEELSEWLSNDKAKSGGPQVDRPDPTLRQKRFARSSGPKFSSIEPRLRDSLTFSVGLAVFVNEMINQVTMRPTVLMLGSALMSLPVMLRLSEDAQETDDSGPR